MIQVKVSRTFPRNKFYIGLLLDWMEQVEERNFRSILSRALINLKAYPLNVETFGDLKIIRGIGDQLAEKLDAAWNAFCSENVGTPTLKQIEQMKRGDFFQYLNSSQISKSQNVKRSKKKMNGNIRDVKFGHSQIRKHLKKSEAQSIDENIYTDAQVSCSQVHRGKREVARGPVDLGKDTETVNACDDSERLEEVCSASQQCDISIVYSPFTFFTSQIILIIDNRESGNPAKFQRMCRLFDKEKIPYEMRSLSVGDYLWILRMHDGSEMVLDYIVERKTNNDLYDEQKQRLILSGIPNIVYILEGTRVFEPALEQALVTTHVENRFLVYRTNDAEHTALVLARITERMVRNASTRELTGMKFENFQRISKKTQRRNVKDVFLRQLLVCPMISAQKASAIVDRFPSFFALRNFYSSLPIEQRETALFENVPGISKVASKNMAKFFA